MSAPALQRREFITLIGVAVAASPWRAHAQPTPVIGLLVGAQNIASAYLGEFKQSLAEMGFIEGSSVRIESRSAEGHYERLPALAAELVSQRVAVIAANSPVAALAAKAATTTIPIVFELGSDPVRDGLVASLNRPGGNLTGVTFFSNLLSAKRLELLHDIVPDATVVGFLMNLANANAELELSEMQAGARALGLRLVVVGIGVEEELEGAFSEFARQRATALVVAGDAYLGVLRKQMAALALRHGIATSHSNSASVEAGGLVSYSANRTDSARQFGRYVGRVLKGEKPADLPVVQPTKFEMVINLRTAKALRLTISRELLFRADEVIE